VFVRRSSSYWTSLEALNARLKAAGRAPANLIPAPDVLEDEDLLEMANAGLAKTLVVDDYLAKFWQQVFPNIVLHERAALRTGASIAPAVRKTSPKLQAELNAMVPKLGARTAFGNQNLQRYLKSTKYVKSATAQEDMARFLRIANLFQTYGEKYHMDWLLMTAQGYQESRLDHAAKSAVGAIGVMQVMPATGKQLAVGDIHDLVHPREGRRGEHHLRLAFGRDREPRGRNVSPPVEQRRQELVARRRQERDVNAQVSRLVLLVELVLERLHRVEHEPALHAVVDEVVGTAVRREHADHASLHHGVEVAGPLRVRSPLDRLFDRRVLRGHVRRRDGEERAQRERCASHVAKALRSSAAACATASRARAIASPMPKKPWNMPS
jgi:hypothetical protein